MNALQVLAKNRRLMIVLVPESATDRFVAKLTSWVNYVLDVKMEAPLPHPIKVEGDGLTCPYCGVPASMEYQLHKPDCTWRQAIIRWASSQTQIERDFR